jgi:hypothetical protein
MATITAIQPFTVPPYLITDNAFRRFYIWS